MNATCLTLVLVMSVKADQESKDFYCVSLHNSVLSVVFLPCLNDVLAEAEGGQVQKYLINLC